MFYNNNFWGMDIIWWGIWVVMIFWIFATPYDIPGQRRLKNGPLDILAKRFASGQIAQDEYETRKNILTDDLA
jgi:putative membrane protein